MNPSEPIDRARSALLIMDFQAGIVERFGGADQAGLLGRTRAAIDAARDAAVQVIFVAVGFRAGYPEVSPRNAGFGTVKASGMFAPGDPNAQIHPALGSGAADIIVTKRRVSAFTGSDLEVVLRSKGIETLVLAGIATSGVVLSTLRQAADVDYRIIVLSDCCADRDPEVHRCLLEKVFPRQAAVITGADFRAALAPA
jgi:nicotinamidase-related amidase